MHIFQYLLALKVPSLDDHVTVNHFMVKNFIFITYNINIYIPASGNNVIDKILLHKNGIHDNILYVYSWVLIYRVSL